MRRTGRFIEIDVSEPQLDRAKELYTFKDIPNSILNGKGNLSGAVGEVVFMDFLAKHNRKYNYAGVSDYDLEYAGYLIDVKTKRINYKPLAHYSVSVADTSLHQQCDVYVFVHTLLPDFKKAWLDGWLFKEDYIKKATHLLEGEPDPLDEKFTIRQDCRNLQIHNLNQF